MKQINLLIGLIFIGNLTFGQSKNFIDQHYLETTAKVDTLIKPDIIYLDILIREKDEKNKISVEELENNMAEKLKILGIDVQKQLILSDLSSNFKKYFLKQKDIMKSKAYKLKVFDAQTAGKVIVGLEDIGISNVSLDKTEYSKIEELKLKLKSKAVAKAKMQAEYLIAPLNQKITKALFITDTYFQSYNYNGELDEIVVIGFSGKRMKQDYQPIDIEFKPIIVEAEVSIKFGIE
ncbi:MAG TPA: SIMPL domain-containing protein [Gelidibacter sp.]|uniref:SIMPL domain-containing protein n=1 Tax=Gelidibacter sp. TaxID=2018083 RepID=UPI002BC2483F|nr:SIMPL domain-containing protein [Gelidibacter sp.]HXJ97939.1 SIMPL domain-containing protein [Gelidibacter sp.]